METLIDHGANVNAQAKCGYTALHYAAELNNPHICCLLLLNGAKLLPNVYGLTPDLCAAEMAQETLTVLFLQWPQLLKKEEVSIYLNFNSNIKY